MATRFDVTVTVASNRLPHLQAQGKRRASAAVRRAGFNTARHAAPFTPVDTGALKANFVLDISNGGLSATLRWAQFYAVFQNMGTKGATAAPGSFLVFEIGGRKIFAKSVAGVTGKHFAEKGAEAAFPRFKSDMGKIYGGGA